MSGREPAEGSRTRILRAAAEIASECGYEATTISKITKRSGLPVSSVYWYFADKDELFSELVRLSFEEWNAQQTRWEHDPEDRRPLAERLRAILSRSVVTLAQAPDFLRIGHMLLLQSRAVEPEARRYFVGVREQVEATITDWFRGYLDEEVLVRRPELPGDLAKVVIAATDGVFLAHQIGEPWDADDFVALVVSVVEAAVAEAAA